MFSGRETYVSALENVCLRFGKHRINKYVFLFVCLGFQMFFRIFRKELLAGRKYMNIYVDFSLRLFVAGLMGVLIGLEREYRAKEAGYRTHFLVALGSALLMIVSQYGFMDVLEKDLVRLDPSRLAAQVVSGIGFIGAGTIILLQKQVVRGLTTAAGVWTTAGIGLAVGSGMYMIGILATFLVLAGLEVLSYCFKSIGMRSMIIELTAENSEALKALSGKFSSENFQITSYEMNKVYENNHEAYRITMVIRAKRVNEEGLLLMMLHEFPDVTVNRIV